MDCKWDDDDKEEKAGGPSHEPYTQLLDELKLQEVSILRRMAKKA